MENIATMTVQQKLQRVVRKAADHLPGDMRAHLLAFVSPEALSIMAVVVTVWAGSHFFGVGEIADVVLLFAGWLALGGAALNGSRKLFDFAITTYNASSQADLDRAARDLSDAINILGIDVVLGLLFKGRPSDTFKQPWRPHVKLPGYSDFKSVMPPAGPGHMYPAEVVFS